MMNKILVISPHFDDAVLSAGHHMAGRPDSEVVTVFGGVPKGANRIHTPYDEKCGFSNAEDAVSSRKHENNLATAMLRATHIDLGFPDNQYNQDVSEDQIVEQLQDILDNGDYEYIMAPLGLGHPDHLMTTHVVLRLKTELPIYLWEDLPLRVIEPELVQERLKELNITTSVWNTSTDKEKMADKVRALSCYTSQIGTGILDPYLLYVPERFYKYEN